MLFTTETIGDIYFSQGYTDSEDAVVEVKKKGELLERRDEGGWTYCYYLYFGRVIGAQWQTGIYVGCWISEEDDLMEIGRKRYHEYMGDADKSTKKSKDAPKFSDMVKKQRDKALKKGNVNSEGVQFADTDMEEYANDIIGFANNIINLEAEIKAEYERTSEMPHDLMQQLFNNIYSLDHYKKLLDGEYHVWLARYGIEG